MSGGHCFLRLVALGHLATLLLSHVSLTVSEGPIIDTDKGPIRGTSEMVNGKKVDLFFGIPYAAPPLGDLRYRPPVQNDPWKGVLDATRFPNSCFQGYDMYFGNFSGATMWNANTQPSEDCLYLNVWVPRTNPPYSDKAVLVWIYGGAFTTGTSTLDIYRASILAAENDVIVVSMQYRVGSLGFLALPKTDAPGNAGLRDQKMALEWIARNIKNFGGSPNNVTIMGESAGAASVGMFLMCEMCRGLFHKAILQSGAPQAKWAALPMETITKRSEMFAKVMGCGEHNDHEHMIQCLRAMPYTQAVIDEEANRTTGVLQPAFVPVVDGIFLRQHPTQLLRTGNFQKVPILIGSNANEGTYFLIYADKVFPRTTAPVINTKTYENLMKNLIFKHYPYFPYPLNDFGQEAIIFHYKDWINPDNEAALTAALDQSLGDSKFVCPVNELGKVYSKYNQPVYYYWFSQRWSAHPWHPWMGVLHADEIWFTFGHPFNSSYSFTEQEKDLSKKMMAYWTNFAKTGDPNPIHGDMSLPEWPRYKHNEQLYLNLSVASFASGHPWGQGPRAQHCAFWDEYLPKLISETSDISEVEKEWKQQFHEWKNHYIVDWKNQFQNFISSYQRRMGTCGGGRP